MSANVPGNDAIRRARTIVERHDDQGEIDRNDNR